MDQTGEPNAPTALTGWLNDGVKLDPAVTDDGAASGSDRSEIIKDKGFLGFFPL